MNALDARLLISRPTIGQRLLPWILIATAVGIAVIAGLLAATGVKLFVGVLAAAVLGLALLQSPSTHTVVAMVFALVATGVLEFFFFFGQANWMSSLIVGSGLLAAALHSLRPRSRNDQASAMTAFGLMVLAYLTVLTASSLINAIPIGQAIVGLRNYVPYIGVAALLLYCGLRPQFVEKLPLGLLAIAVIQVPVALYQHLVVGPWRAALRNAVGRPDEAIVGTFGGSAITGGYTGEMAAFLVMMIIFVVALRRERVMSTGLAVCLAVLLLVPILVAETKVALVLLPLLLMVCFWRDAVRNPKFFVSVILAGALLVGVVAVVYFWRYWGDQRGAIRTLTYSFDPDFMVTAYHRGRVGTLVHWFQTIVADGQVVATLFGHGVASALENSATIGYGTAVAKYGLGLDSHAMSRLLWDVGVVGLLAFMALPLWAFFVARRLAQSSSASGLVRAALTALSGAALAMTMMLPYQTSVLGGSAMQFLFWFCLGFVEYQRRRLSGPVPG